MHFVGTDDDAVNILVLSALDAIPSYHLKQVRIRSPHKLSSSLSQSPSLGVSDSTVEAERQQDRETSIYLSLTVILETQIIKR